MDSIEAIKPGRRITPNRQGLYAKTAKHAYASIDTLVELLHSRNENIQLGAAKALLNKCLPDLKALDANVTAHEPEEYIIQIVEDKQPLN